MTELHVHHCSYERFGNEPLSDLITLCEYCHRAVHKLHHDQGGDLAMATAEALAVLRSAGRMPSKAKTPKRRSRKPRKRQAAPLDPSQLEDAQAAVDALLASGLLNRGMVRSQVIPVLKGQLRHDKRSWMTPTIDVDTRQPLEVE